MSGASVAVWVSKVAADTPVFSAGARSRARQPSKLSVATAGMAGSEAASAAGQQQRADRAKRDGMGVTDGRVSSC